MLDRHESPDGERDEQEQHEVEPFPWLGDGEREPRLRERDVVGEEGHDRRGDSRPGAPQRPDGHDRDEVHR